MRISEKGQILPLVLVMILISVLLAVTIADIGFVVIEKIRTQAAADAGALAGATFIARENNSYRLLKFTSLGASLSKFLYENVTNKKDPFGIADFVLLEHLSNFIPILGTWAIQVGKDLELKRIYSNFQLDSPLFKLAKSFIPNWGQLISNYKYLKNKYIDNYSPNLKGAFVKALAYALLNYPDPVDIKIELSIQPPPAKGSLLKSIKIYKFNPKKEYQNKFMISEDCHGKNPEYQEASKYSEMFPEYVEFKLKGSTEMTCEKCTKEMLVCDESGNCELKCIRREIRTIKPKISQLHLNPAPFGNIGWGSAELRDSSDPQTAGLHDAISKLNEIMPKTLNEICSAYRPFQDNFYPKYSPSLSQYSAFVSTKLSKLLTLVHEVMPKYYDPNSKFIAKSKFSIEKFSLAMADFFTDNSKSIISYVDVTVIGGKIPLFYHFLPENKQNIVSAATGLVTIMGQVTYPEYYTQIGSSGVALINKIKINENQ